MYVSRTAPGLYTTTESRLKTETIAGMAIQVDKLASALNGNSQSVNVLK